VVEKECGERARKSKEELGEGEGGNRHENQL
jgi:hypothetical protein